MDSFNLVNSLQALQALPETDPIEVDGIQFGPTCVNVQTNGTGGCLALTVGIPVNVGLLQTVIGGIGIGIGVLGTGAGVGC